jgi:ribosomal silencing factor RsfS
MSTPTNSAEQLVQVTLRLPQSVYDHVVIVAGNEKRQLEDLLSTLVSEGLNVHATVRELLEQVSEQYRARLAREGKLEQSGDEILQELRTLREQIARELYP